MTSTSLTVEHHLKIPLHKLQTADCQSSDRASDSGSVGSEPPLFRRNARLAVQIRSSAAQGHIADVLMEASSSGPPVPTTYSGYLDPAYLRQRFGRQSFSTSPRASHDHSPPSSDDGDDDDDSTATDDSEAERLAKLEWDESVRQLQLLLDVVLLPFLGKWAGRKWAYWSTSCPRRRRAVS